MKLMEILMSKEPSYVRCIKPNDAKQPGTFLHLLIKICCILQDSYSQLLLKLMLNCCNCLPYSLHLLFSLYWKHSLTKLFF